MGSTAKQASAPQVVGVEDLDALGRAGRGGEAENIARDRIARNEDRESCLAWLVKTYAAKREHERLLELFADNKASDALKSYGCQTIRASSLIETQRYDEARLLLLQLIVEHNFLVPLRLYRRLPPRDDALDMAVAAFGRSQRSSFTKTTQALALVDIATACGEFERARFIMMQVLGWIGETTFTAPPKPKRYMDPGFGAAALVDLHDLLTPRHPFFLISGTLLGVIREGRLLGADKDIDVGVMGDAGRAEIKQLIAASADFEENYVPSSDFVLARHRNGVAIDIFFHHREGDVVWHGSHLHAWDNSKWWAEGEQPFAEVDFAGRSFLIPSDPDRYLTDNYGDWRTPVRDYDASLEAPNRRVRDEKLTRLHWQKLLVRYFMNGDFKILTKAFGCYEATFGRDEFLVEAARLFIMKDLS